VLDSLKSRTIHALAWSFLESVGLQGVRFVIGIVLARVLLPEQFGLIAMLSVFMGVGQTLLDSGFGAALIQKRETTQTDMCSIFYFNIAVGLAVAGLLCLSAPWVAAFYNQPVLTPLTRAMSLTIVFNSFGMVQATILRKEINFKTQTKASLVASTLSGVIGVTLAILGFGVWSLVVQQLSSAFLQTLLLWHLNLWRPVLVFSFRSLRRMFAYGSRLLASALVSQVFENIYPVVIGKLFSAADLGFVTRAQTFGDLPSRTLSGMVARVTFPVFSAMQDDTARMKGALKRALTTLVLINFPMMIGLAVIARPLVLVLLTDKWAESIPYLQLICFSALIYPLHVINLNLLQALGRSDFFLRLEIMKKVLIVINIAVTWRWGIFAMIYGMIALSIVCYYLNSYYSGILIGYSIREQLRDLSSYLIMAVLMGTGVYLVGFVPFPNLWSRLLIQISAGTVIYVLLCRLFRLEAFMEIWEAGRDRMAILKTRTTE
jgi:teichuronic acid exporter